jgi:hypothetical protein
MLLVERQPTQTAPGGNSTNSFRLQICVDATNQQLVDLPQGKTTIGSSPRCDIRIQQPEVQPLHCLILCEGGRLSARRWAAGTRLNGQPFDEAPLVPGDRLKFGLVEIVVEETFGAATSVECAPFEVINSPAPELPSGEDASPSIESWDEWHSIRETQLRQTDAVESVRSAERVDAEPKTEWPTQWSQQRENADHSAALTGVHEQLLLLEETLSSWKDTRENWQQERAELRAEREQTQQQWAKLEREIAVLQSRAFDIAGRVERLEQSIAETQSAAAKPSAPVVDTPSLGTPTWQFGEPLDSGRFSGNPAGSFDATHLPDADSGDTEDEIAPFAEFSIWNQGATNTSPASDAATDVERHNQVAEPSIAHEADLPALARPDDTQTAPAKSFIEQYGHMFVEDDADRGPPQEAPRASAASGATAKSESITQPRETRYAAPEGSIAPPATSDEEESIEQYMSKLLQRVRGERPIPPTVQPNSGKPAFGSAWTPAASSAAVVGAPNQPAATASELSGGVAKGDWLTTSLGTVRRKAPIQEQPADLERLRALANETARRAISTHGLRTHRRNAITKVIVSMLAGMTSLWLMLEAPDWRDLQFITACVSLIAAAYWAGQTFAELIETFRAAAYDGPEDELEGVVNSSSSDVSVDAAKLAART